MYRHELRDVERHNVRPYGFNGRAVGQNLLNFDCGIWNRIATLGNQRTCCQPIDQLPLQDAFACLAVTANNKKVEAILAARAEAERKATAYQGQKAVAIASSPDSAALDDSDARSAALQRRMDTLVAKAKREGMTADVEAEDRTIREEADAIRRGYKMYRG